MKRCGLLTFCFVLVVYLVKAQDQTFDRNFRRQNGRRNRGPPRDRRPPEFSVAGQQGAPSDRQVDVVPLERGPFDQRRPGSLTQGQLESTNQAQLDAGGQGEMIMQGEIAVPTHMLDAARQAMGGALGQGGMDSSRPGSFDGRRQTFDSPQPGTLDAPPPVSFGETGRNERRRGSRQRGFRRRQFDGSRNRQRDSPRSDWDQGARSFDRGQGQGDGFGPERRDRFGRGMLETSNQASNQLDARGTMDMGVDVQIEAPSQLLDPSRSGSSDFPGSRSFGIPPPPDRSGQRPFNSPRDGRSFDTSSGQPDRSRSSRFDSTRDGRFDASRLGQSDSRSSGSFDPPRNGRFDSSRQGRQRNQSQQGQFDGSRPGQFDFLTQGQVDGSRQRPFDSSRDGRFDSSRQEQFDAPRQPAGSRDGRFDASQPPFDSSRDRRFDSARSGQIDAPGQGSFDNPRQGGGPRDGRFDQSGQGRMDPRFGSTPQEQIDRFPTEQFDRPRDRRPDARGQGQFDTSQPGRDFGNSRPGNRGSFTQGQMEATNKANLDASGQGEILIEGEIQVPTHLLKAAQKGLSSALVGAGQGPADSSRPGSIDGTGQGPNSGSTGQGGFDPLGPSTDGPRQNRFDGSAQGNPGSGQDPFGPSGQGNRQRNSGSSSQGHGDPGSSGQGRIDGSSQGGTNSAQQGNNTGGNTGSGQGQSDPYGQGVNSVKDALAALLCKSILLNFVSGVCVCVCSDFLKPPCDYLSSISFDL